MVEALRDFAIGVCGKENSCFAQIVELRNYKAMSAARAIYPQFKTYDFSIWEEVIDIFAMKLSCLMNQASIVTYEQYMETISPHEILKLEEQKIEKKGVFILSAFPEFLLDYFGVKLWRRCIRHTTNQLEKSECNEYFRNR